MEFTKATKEQAKLRLAIFGPSGSGKTYTSLRMAAGLGGKTAVIDTERGSASMYADRFTFDVLELPERDIKTYCQAISVASKAGYSVLIVDSLTHAWHELLAEVDKLARAKYSGNTWSAWSEGTPKQRLLVNAILEFDGHLIATMRTKTEWTTTKDNRGRIKPVRVGLAPEQGKGIEYEFDLLMELSPEHFATVIKDRTGKYQDESIELPGEELGKDLAAWLTEGAAPAPKRKPKATSKPETRQEPAKAARPVWSGVITPIEEDVAEPKPAKAANGKATNGDTLTRPLTAEKLQKGMRTKAKWQDGQRFVGGELVTENQTGAVAGLLEDALVSRSRGNRTRDRHDILEYLYGVRTTSQLTNLEASLIISWLKDDGEGWDINEWAIIEAGRVLEAFAKERVADEPQDSGTDEQQGELTAFFEA